METGSKLKDVRAVRTAYRQSTSPCERLTNYFVNDGLKIVWIIVWGLINAGLFAWKFYEYYVGEKAFAFQTLSWGAPFARASAVCISFNSALMLLTILRNILSWLRGTVFGDLIPIDKNIVFHRHIAFTILGFAIMHIVAHMYNYLVLESGSLERLSHMKLKANVPSYVSMFMKIPGVTGVVATLVMVLMYTSALKLIRNKMFNVFWFTHHLFVIYFIALSVHGTARTFERETFYLWIAGPAALYAIERTARVIRGSTDTMLLMAVAHPSRVLELQMKKSAFTYRPGQYLFLNCPSIATQEWHPFTISSAPEEEFVSVHIRIVGDWTEKMWALFNPNKKLGVVQENLILNEHGTAILRIDGPYGAASEEVFTHHYKTIVLCAAGIGVTPFASILKSIRYRLERYKEEQSIQKVYFFWISRDKHSFEWFNEVLAALENDNVNNFLEIHTYLTQVMRLSEIRSIMYQEPDTEDGLDNITGLQTPPKFGRPDWNTIFSNLGSVHRGEHIGVFFCGPSILSKQLYSMSKKHTSSSTAIFEYHKENF